MSSFPLILRPGRIWLTVQFQSVKYLQILTDSCIHPSTQRAFTESLWSSRHLKLERMNYSVTGLYVNITHLHTKLSFPNLYPLILLSGLVTDLCDIPWTLWSSSNFYFIQNMWWYTLVSVYRKKTTCFSKWTFWEIQR